MMPDRLEGDPAKSNCHDISILPMISRFVGGSRSPILTVERQGVPGTPPRGQRLPYPRKMTIRLDSAGLHVRTCIVGLKKDGINGHADGEQINLADAPTMFDDPRWGGFNLSRVAT